MTDFIERIINWYNDDEREYLRQQVKMYCTFSGIVWALLTVAYWFGHPELILSKRCCRMIVRNCTK